MLKRAARSSFLALRASARFGRAAKLRDEGKSADALRVGREALAILGHPHVVRSNPAEAAVLCSATVLVEGLAHELNVPGATPQDIVDALQAIRSMGPGGEFAEWVPYLEQRAAQIDRDNVG
jgi:hypothetical protein